VTPLALWAAIGLVALVATACWAILARETGVFVTSGLSFTAWSWLALTGGDVGMFVAGEVRWIRDVRSLQFVALALAVVSLVVFALRNIGAYPSAQEAETESDDTDRRTNA
jgi:O-antigen ligase